MVIVAGHIVVDPRQRESYLASCAAVVEQARRTPGCLDFAITADLLVPGRIDIFERWESRAAVEEFRGSGPSDEQGAATVVRIGRGVRRRRCTFPDLTAPAVGRVRKWPDTSPALR